MCTEKCFELTQAPAARRAGPSVSRRVALVGGAAVAASAALGSTAQAGGRAPAFPGGRHGLRDLTYPLTTTFPAFTPGEEAVRRTVVTIENDGYYLQEWRIIEHIGTHVDAPGTSPRAAAWPPSCNRRSWSSPRWSSTSPTGRPRTRTRS